MKSILKYVSAMAVICLVFVTLVACSTNKTSQTTNTEEVSIQDATGEVILSKSPEKIVVLDYGVLDTLKALGLSDKVVGLPQQSLPAYLKEFKNESSFTNVGNLKEVDLEAIAGLEPDLIIASGRTAGQLEAFKEIAQTVYFETDQSQYWTSVKKNITSLASLFGEETIAKAEKKLGEIDSLIKQTAEQNKDTSQTTLMLMLNEGNLAAQGEDGRYGFIYSELGFKPTSLEIPEEKHGGSNKSKGNRGGSNPHGSGLSYESIAEINPDLIFVIDRSLAIGGDTSVNSDLLNNDLLQTTQAGKDKKIITLTSDLWYLSGGGLESIKMMIEETANYADK